MLICKARELVVLSQTETLCFPKKDWGCHQLKYLITCRGRVIPEARMTFFPVLWLVCVALLVCPLGFQKINSFFINLGSAYFVTLHIFAVCGF